MQRVLSGDLWKTVRVKAQQASCRRVAIAYVTQDLVDFRKGDDLVVDASPRAISNGDTSAKLLRALHKNGVRVFDCRGLHAKVLLLGNVAVIGSGNMSRSSESDLIEAAVMTDQPSIVAAVASLIEQVVGQSYELTAEKIETLCTIPVVRRGGRGGRGATKRRAKVTRLGNSTWLIGVYQLAKDPAPPEKKAIEKDFKELRSSRGHPDEVFEYVRWSGRNRFIRKCREGDAVIEIWRSSRQAKTPSAVYRSRPVLLAQKWKAGKRFYYPEPSGRYQKLTWGRFKRLLREVGYPRRVGPGIAHELPPDVADAIARKWTSAAKG